MRHVWIFLLLVAPAWGQHPRAPAGALPDSARARYYNTDGSCVQCSNGYAGYVLRIPQFAELLWTTPYGPAERGGAGPSRVARYARERGVQVVNVTGAQTTAWIEQELLNGRPLSITWDYNHVVSVLDMTDDRQHFLVWNNQWRDGKPRWYSRSEFYRRHSIDGRWAVAYPSYPAPTPAGQYTHWWK